MTKADRLDPRKLLWIGIGGSTIAVLCCATPILMIALAAIGITAVGVWLDAGLVTALTGFLALTGYALWKKHHVQQ